MWSRFGGPIRDWLLLTTGLSRDEPLSLLLLRDWSTIDLTSHYQSKTGAGHRDSDQPPGTASAGTTTTRYDTELFFAACKCAATASPSRSCNMPRCWHVAERVAPSHSCTSPARCWRCCARPRPALMSASRLRCPSCRWHGEGGQGTSYSPCYHQSGAGQLHA